MYSLDGVTDTLRNIFALDNYSDYTGVGGGGVSDQSIIKENNRNRK